MKIRALGSKFFFVHFFQLTITIAIEIVQRRVNILISLLEVYIKMQLDN